jgi:hypothetical protein
LTGPGEDNDNVNAYGVNRFSGFNISTIAIEVPITRITSDGCPGYVGEPRHRHMPRRHDSRTGYWAGSQRTVRADIADGQSGSSTSS